MGTDNRTERILEDRKQHIVIVEQAMALLKPLSMASIEDYDTLRDAYVKLAEAKARMELALGMQRNYTANFSVNANEIQPGLVINLGKEPDITHWEYVGTDWTVNTKDKV